jgi:hypothetical protein
MGAGNGQGKANAAKIRPMKLNAKSTALFWTHVNVREEDKCWEWMAYRNPDGYGIMGVGRGTASAHRYSYLLAFGDFDLSLRVRHTCDNPPCVNPKHLLLGTQGDNVIDCITRGRRGDMSRPGSRNAMAKLTEELVLRLRSEWIPRIVTARDLSAKFNVPHSTVSKVLLRKTWKHV